MFSGRYSSKMMLISIHADELGHEWWWSQFMSMVAFQRVLAEYADPCWTMAWLSYFPLFWDASLTNCWLSVFLDVFGPTAKWPWAYCVLPAVQWCSLPTSHLPPNSHLQSSGVPAHPNRTTSLAPFYPAENILQTEKATFLKLVDFSGIISGFTCKTEWGCAVSTADIPVGSSGVTQLFQHFCATLCPPRHLWPEV